MNISKLLNPLPEFSAVILDLDGLVLDTEATYFLAWQRAAQDLGYNLSETFCLSLSGMHYAAIEAKILQYCGHDFPVEQFRLLSTEHWKHYVSQYGIAVKKGLFELLDVLADHNLPFCIATNSHAKDARQSLQFAGVENLFEILVSRDQVKNAKPAPDIFISAASQLGVSIDACLVVEDSHSGILAAHRANAFPVLIPSTQTVLPETAKLSGMILDDLAKLAEIISTQYKQ